MVGEGPASALIEAAAKRASFPNAVSEFHGFVREAFPTKKSYVGIKYMEEQLHREDHPEMATLLGITLRHYLKEVLPLEVVRNGSLRKKERLGLLKKVRAVYKTLFGRG